MGLFIVQEFDLKVKNHLQECLINSNNEIETKIINYCLLLSDLYSFSKYQTYPRPEHPLPSKRKSVYFTMVAILVSLRTTLDNEQKAVENFIEHFENIDQVINANINELAEIIKCAGMPNKKAETIIQASKYVKENFNNDWTYFDNLSAEKSRGILKNIPGIGEKSADCLLELGLNKPSIVIDVNMLRIVSRLFNFEWAKNPDLSSKIQL
ncbi:MAG: endonuclease III domain-containing protein [Rickettsiales bacterium]|nr:endonuclease III domain-containing protein [Rickettsiales bacterium]